MLLHGIVFFFIFLLLKSALSFVAIRQYNRLPHSISIKLCKTSDRHQHRYQQQTSRGQHHHQRRCTWSPQDLTANVPRYPQIPEDDYIKKYQTNPELWPVEFFVIAYRRIQNKETKQYETQILVRKSANGTSKYGLGTGVPVTRWVLSQANPPNGYEITEPHITFDACWYPEYPKNRKEESWKYKKIDMKEDAFTNNIFEDDELETYATRVRDALRSEMIQRINGEDNLTSWELSTASIVKKILDNPNSVVAIQGSFRMLGLFEKKDEETNNERYVSFDDAPAPSTLAESMRIYTMFPQMPDPMPLPSTSSKDLQHEIATRGHRMAENGRDSHKDKYGRRYTHISTSNVSNTIHGVYLSVDATDFNGIDDIHGLDLFGTTKVDREWVSLENLKVISEDGTTIGTDDTKPTFISGFIARQLVKEGVIPR